MFAGSVAFVLYATLFRFALVPRVLAGFGIARGRCSEIIAVAMPLFGQPVVFPLIAPLGLRASRARRSGCSSKGFAEHEPAPERAAHAARLDYAFAMPATVLPAKPRGLALMLGWQRVLFTLGFTFVLSLPLGLGWKSGYRLAADPRARARPGRDARVRRVRAMAEAAAALARALGAAGARRRARDAGRHVRRSTCCRPRRRAAVLA